MYTSVSLSPDPLSLVSSSPSPFVLTSSLSLCLSSLLASLVPISDSVIFCLLLTLVCCSPSLLYFFCLPIPHVYFISLSLYLAFPPVSFCLFFTPLSFCLLSPCLSFASSDSLVFLFHVTLFLILFCLSAHHYFASHLYISLSSHLFLCLSSHLDPPSHLYLLVSHLSSSLLQASVSPSLLSSCLSLYTTAFLHVKDITTERQEELRNCSGISGRGNTCETKKKKKNDKNVMTGSNRVIAVDQCCKQILSRKRQVKDSTENSPTGNKSNSRQEEREASTVAPRR